MSEHVMDLDSERADRFAGRMITMLNESATALMISIGHRTGLFDVMATRPARTSAELARHAGLHERYIREWLGAMTTATIVEHDPVAGTFSLPAEHALFLTRAAVPNNIAAFTQYVAVLGAVEDNVVDAFVDGQGVPYAAYKRFHAVMAEESAQTVVAALFDHILPLMPGLAERLTQGIAVLDVGCGSGRALLLLAEHFPASRFTGFDISEETIGSAQATAAKQGLTNLHFAVHDAAQGLPGTSYDLITAFDAIHDQAQPDQVLRHIAAALRPGGTFLMQDIAASSTLHNNMDHPVGPFLYTISCMHCMSVSLAAGGPGLGAMWGKELALSMLRDAGFHDIRVEQLAHDFQNYYYIMTV